MDLEQTRTFWNQTAADWDIQVGEEGDNNRRLNSDPVLWKFAGEVRGRTVLDAGCGTGYLARQLHQRGAQVIGIDFAPAMCEIARAKAPDMDIRLDSCTTLDTVSSSTVDLIVSNYVLMDTPDLEGSVSAFFRVLKPGGSVVLVFSHPCFPQGRSRRKDGLVTEYRWESCYFERAQCVDPPWRHFQHEFIWFHRPLSDYWKAFRGAGFSVDEFEEPRLTPSQYALATSPEELEAHKTRPYSVAFKLRKPND